MNKDYARLTEVVLNDDNNSPLATYAYNKKDKKDLYCKFIYKRDY